MTQARPSASVSTPGNSAVAFPPLADPAAYVACRWDLTADAAHRGYWLALFRRHFPTLLAEAVREAVHRGGGESEADIRGQTALCLAQFNAVLDRYTAEPGCRGRLDILTICRDREAILRQNSIADPYRQAKSRENQAALRLLPALLTELDALAPAERARRIIEGVFAGNIFDLGATSTLALFESGRGVDFHAIRAKLAPRPWLIDDLDAFLARLARGPAYRRAVLFVDNAGCDIVLGMIPLARELLARGGSVVMTANQTPSLNDVTIAELAELIDAVARGDAPLARAREEGRLELVSSGNDAPLIDLSHVSPGLAAAAARGPADLVVLEGMGRAVESNLDARFTCDVLKLAMIKDQGVADALGGKLYDLVLRYEPA